MDRSNGIMCMYRIRGTFESEGKGEDEGEKKERSRMVFSKAYGSVVIKNRREGRALRNQRKKDRKCRPRLFLVWIFLSFSWPAWSFFPL